MKNISIKTLVASLLLIGATSVLAMEQTQESVKRFNSGAKTGVRSICFSSDGKQIIGSVDDKAMVWDSQNRDVLYTLPGSTGQVVTDAKLNRDGSLILIASHKDAFIWDVRTKTMLHALSGHKNGVSSVQFSPDEAQVITSSWDNTVVFWDARTGRKLRTINCPHPVLSAKLNRDGDRIATSFYDIQHDNGEVNRTSAIIWDVRTGRRIIELNGGHIGRVNSVEFSPNEDTIVTTSGDKTIIMWDAHNGRQLYVLRGHAHHVSVARFSPDGSKIVSISHDKKIIIWDTQTGELLYRISGNHSEISDVRFTVEGTQLLISTHGGQVCLYDVPLNDEMQQAINASLLEQQVPVLNNGAPIAQPIDDQFDNEMQQAINASLIENQSSRPCVAPRREAPAVAPVVAVAAQAAACNICLEDKQAGELITLSCDHAYCGDCLNHLVDNAIAEKSTAQLKCPNADCARPINERDVRAIANNDQIKLAAYGDIATREWIVRQPNARHCPTPDCSSVFLNDGANAQSTVCAECNHRYCSNCLFDHERATSCRAAEAARAGDNAYNEWKRLNTKECPQCRAAIEKNGGCSTVLCSQCMHAFCWDCKGPYNHQAHDCRPVAQ